jgi:hypothetical protein
MLRPTAHVPFLQSQRILEFGQRPRFASHADPLEGGRKLLGQGRIGNANGGRAAWRAAARRRPIHRLGQHRFDCFGCGRVKTDVSTITMRPRLLYAVGVCRSTAPIAV